MVITHRSQDCLAWVGRWPHRTEDPGYCLFLLKMNVLIFLVCVCVCAHVSTCLYMHQVCAVPLEV